MANTVSTASPNIVLPEHVRARLEQIFGSLGESKALRELNLPRNTTTRAMARRPIRRGSLLLIEQAVVHYDAKRSA